MLPSMKKTFFLSSLMLMLSVLIMAQARFTWKIDKHGDKELVLIFTGALDPGWHINEQSLTIETAEGVNTVGTFSDGRQRFAITGRRWSIKGYMEYLVCSDEQCLAPQYVEFNASGEAEEKADDKLPQTPQAEQSGTQKADTPSHASVDTVAPVTKDTATIQSPTTPTVPTEQPETPTLLRTMLIAFLAGLLALLTPCVWPVIPLTVSFFLKSGRGIRDALLFGGSIVCFFLLLGLGMTLLLGADAMNSLATNAVFNVVCFVVLTLFGLSFIGLFNISLPSSWTTSLDSAATRKGGTLGIMLMALTLVVVSFSCTAPIVGTLLVEIASNRTSLMTPLMGMLSFSMALALPFTLFAVFPSWMKRMPRSGQWMQHVKVVLGVLELAFALKFLSVADMAYGWHLMSWRTFLILWALLFGGLSVYLLLQWRNSRPAALCALLPLLLTVYIINGACGGDTRLVSAFMPPRDDVSQTVYTDYYEGIAEAKRTGRLVFLDFTGYGCVNCRKMEAAVFTDPRVEAELSKYIIIRLYVDDRTPLTAKQTVTSTDGRKITLRTVGDRWSHLEQQRFGQLTQPLYVVLNPDGTMRSPTVYSYNEDTEAFLKWINETAD